jgi:hypothetical protein
MELTTPGRLAAAPRGGTEPDRETRIGFGALTPPHPLVACGNLSPRARQARFMRRGSRDSRWSN